MVRSCINRYHRNFRTFRMRCTPSVWGSLLFLLIVMFTQSCTQQFSDEVAFLCFPKSLILHPGGTSTLQCSLALRPPVSVSELQFTVRCMTESPYIVCEPSSLQVGANIDFTFQVRAKPEASVQNYVVKLRAVRNARIKPFDVLVQEKDFSVHVVPDVSPVAHVFCDDRNHVVFLRSEVYQPKFISCSFLNEDYDEFDLESMFCSSSTAGLFCSVEWIGSVFIIRTYISPDLPFGQHKLTLYLTLKDPATHNTFPYSHDVDVSYLKGDFRVQCEPGYLSPKKSRGSCTIESIRGLTGKICPSEEFYECECGSAGGCTDHCQYSIEWSLPNQCFQLQPNQKKRLFFKVSGLTSRVRFCNEGHLVFYYNYYNDNYGSWGFEARRLFRVILCD